MTGGPAPAPRTPEPEGNWRWRRIYTYAGAIAGLALLAAIVWKLTGQRELMWVALGLIIRDAWRETLYIVAPSAQAIVAGIDALPKGRGR